MGILNAMRSISDGLGAAFSKKRAFKDEWQSAKLTDFFKTAGASDKKIDTLQQRLYQDWKDHRTGKGNLLTGSNINHYLVPYGNNPDSEVSQVMKGIETGFDEQTPQEIVDRIRGIVKGTNLEKNFSGTSSKGIHDIVETRKKQVAGISDTGAGTQAGGTKKDVIVANDSPNGSSGGGGNGAAPQAGGDTDTEKTVMNAKDFNEAIGRVEEGRANDQMKERLTTSRQNLAERLKDANGDEKKISGLMKDYDIDDYKKGTRGKDLEELIDKSFLKKVQDGPTAGDYFRGYHGPGLTASAIGGASMLTFMNSKGQMSNSQLYSDPFA